MSDALLIANEKCLRIFIHNVSEMISLERKSPLEMACRTTPLRKVELYELVRFLTRR